MELLLNGYMVSVGEDGKVLETGIVVLVSL